MKMSNEYIEDEELLEIKSPTSVPIYEQEVYINMMRDEKTATIYTSDSTYITKLDKLCNSSPDMYSVIEETKCGKTYLLQDKTLISFRAKKKELSDEQRQAAGDRMRKYQANKSAQNEF